MENKEDYIQRLFPRVIDINDDEIRKKVIDLWWGTWKESGFEKIEDLSQWQPVKEKLNMSNVDHTNQVVECALAMADVVEGNQGVKIERDTLIAGAILHDVDKLLIFHPTSGETTRMGKHLAHTTLGAHLALQAGLPLGIVHTIAAHSSNHSSMSPRSVEAVIVYYADHVVTETWITAKNIDISFAMKSDSQ
ncbi:MAG: HD domain-containing protein [Syntrophaceae bacterium]|nr:HD domain-containing protein [Syntrophaceae bacterium]